VCGKRLGNPARDDKGYRFSPGMVARSQRTSLSDVWENLWSNVPRGDGSFSLAAREANQT